MAHDEERLHQAVWSFHTALQRRDGVEARLRRGESDTDLCDRSLTAAEAVVESRLALYQVFIDEGWTPPDSVVAEIELDSRLLHEPAEHPA